MIQYRCLNQDFHSLKSGKNPAGKNVLKKNEKKL